MRKIHHVGSLPPEITERGPYLAMDWALATSGWYRGHADLTGVPCDLDPHWIVDYLDRLASEEFPIPVPALRVLRKGDSHDYDHTPLLRPGRKRIMNDAVFSMERVEALKAVIDDYRQLRENHRQAPHRHSLGPMPPLRISLPSPLDLALIVFCGKVDLKRHAARTARGIWLAVKHFKKFGRAMVNEVTEITRYAFHNDVAIVWQLEAPSVLYAMNLVPRPLQRYVATIFAEITSGTLFRIWDNLGVELHLCSGDLGHKALTQGTPAQMVLFLNRLGPLLDHAGIDRPAVHLPFAYGDQPAPTDAAYYTPLAELTGEWTIYAGVVDEHDAEASWKALHHVEQATGRTVAAVAPACGLGRRSVADAEDAIEGCVALLDVDRAEGVKDSEEEK
jgi:hypothetical protein